MITVSQVLAELQEIADAARKANGGRDYVYFPPGGGDCKYVHTDKATGASTPGCIVGVWLHTRHGVPLTALSEEENHGASEVLTDLGFTATTDALSALDAIQRRQDNAVAWCDAVSTTALNYACSGSTSRVL